MILLSPMSLKQEAIIAICGRVLGFGQGVLSYLIVFSKSTINATHRPSAQDFASDHAEEQ